MSAPAAKAFSEPVITTAPTPLSAWNASSALPTSSIKAPFSALSAFGRLSVINPTRPRVSTMMFSKTMSVLIPASDRSLGRLFGRPFD